MTWKLKRNLQEYEVRDSKGHLVGRYMSPTQAKKKALNYSRKTLLKTYVTKNVTSTYKR